MNVLCKTITKVATEVQKTGSFCQLQLTVDVADGGYLFLTLNIRLLQLGTQSTVSSVTPGMTRGATTPGTGHTPRR